MLQQDVRWEQFRKREVFQCRNCQRLGHASSECGLGYRCVKCVEKHEPGQCPRNGADKNTTKAACINCHEAGIESDHAANYRRCPYLRFAQGEQDDWRHKRRVPKPDGYFEYFENNTPAAIKLNLPKAPKSCLSTQENTAITQELSRPIDTHNETLSYTNMTNLLSKFSGNIMKDLSSLIQEKHNHVQNQLNEQNKKIEYIFKKIGAEWP